MKPRARVEVSLLALFFAACTAGPPYPEGSIDKLFPQPPRPQERYYSAGAHRIHYVQMPGPAQEQARIVFIHGSPGDWQAWAHYLADPELQRRATLIAVDRPGFGASDPGRAVPDLREQARLLEPLLRGEGGERVPTILVGHSLGGPIAGELAMDYPDEVQGAVLVAPSIDPATEQPRWYNHAMTWRVVQALTPAEFTISNREIMPLADELTVMAPRWRSLSIPITVVQGEEDKLVDPRTADFAQASMRDGGHVIRVPQMGHFVLWEKPEVVVKSILDTLDSAAHSTLSVTAAP